MNVSVVILNWNTRNYLGDFLPELIKSCEGMDAEIVVADNGSSDGSVEYLESNFPEVRTISFETNFGFTGGYNRAINQVVRDVNPEYIVLLNSDILVERDWLIRLEEFMDSHPKCGVCGSKLLKLETKEGAYNKTSTFEYAGAAGGYLDKYGFPYCRGRILHNCEEDYGQYDDETKVFWVSGACLMTRASLWTELGGLDERFFAHQEEIDYCWRVQRSGFEIWSVPGSKVYHLGGGTLNNSSAWKLELNFRNSLWMLAKNLSSVTGYAGAKRLLLCRRCVDNCAALLYLVTLRFAQFGAVCRAHRAFRRSGGMKLVEDCPKAQIVGYQNFCVILHKFFK